MSNFRKLSAYFILSVAAAMLVALPAAAQDKDAKAATSGGGSSSYKIGVVDIEKVIEGYAKKTSLMNALQAKVDQMQKDINALTDKAKALQTKLETDAAKMSDADRAATQSQYNELVTDIKAETSKRQFEIDQEEAKIKSEVFADVSAAITAVAESENYHLVLNSRGAPNTSVLYASSTIDITSKVSAKLGAK
jgi:outer membrane protein